MKKLLALLLILACIFSFAACGDKENPDDDKTNTDDDNVTTDPQTNAEVLAYFKSLLDKSVPTKSVVTTTQTVRRNVLKTTVTLTTGENEGKKVASLVTIKETFNDIESGKLNLVKENTSTQWYREDLGVSTDKGRNWDEGESFAPVEKSLRLDLKEENFSSITYNKEAGELILVAPDDTAADVISYFLPGGDDYVHEYETTIQLYAFGGRITGMNIFYTIPEADIDVDSDIIVIPETVVKINAAYSYGLQTVSFE